MSLNSSDVRQIFESLIGENSAYAKELSELLERNNDLNTLFLELAQKPEFIHTYLSEILQSGGLDLDDHIYCRGKCVDAAPQTGFITDAFGLRTRTAYAAKWAPLDGSIAPWRFRQCFEHDVTEWYGLLRSIDRAVDKFVVAELGAGWGPWITAGSVLARRAGLKDILTIAVEADETRYGFIAQHRADNGVADVECKTFLGAIAPSDGWVLFPEIPDSTKDMGMAAIFSDRFSDEPEKDYRGVKLSHRKSIAYSVGTVLDGIECVDFMHIDIQGAEAEVLSSCADLVTEKCRHLLIATHSRKVEWIVAETLMARGWVLEKERPCEMYFGDSWRKSGRTWPLIKRDGTQFWRNPAKVDLAPGELVAR